MKGFVAVLRKEAIHMRRDKGTLRLALGIPVFQLILFGSIDTNVTSVPTAVFDQCRCAESRSLLDELEATKTFRIAHAVSTRASLREAIVAYVRATGGKVTFERKKIDPVNFSTEGSVPVVMTGVR